VGGIYLYVKKGNRTQGVFMKGYVHISKYIENRYFDKKIDVMSRPLANKIYKCPICKEETGHWIVRQYANGAEEILIDFPTIGADIALCKKHGKWAKPKLTYNQHEKRTKNERKKNAVGVA
jgi:hypothetical protein